MNARAILMPLRHVSGWQFGLGAVLTGVALAIVAGLAFFAGMVTQFLVSRGALPHDAMTAGASLAALFGTALVWLAFGGRHPQSIEVEEEEPLMSDALSKSTKAVFEWLVEHALQGRRCPTNPMISDYLYERGLPIGGEGSGHISRLAAEGHIRVEIFARNWRVITILNGPHRDKATQACPMPGAQPYKVLPQPAVTP